MELSQLVFSTETSKLDEAVKKIEALGSAVKTFNDINSDSARAEREAAAATKAAVKEQERLTKALKNKADAEKQAAAAAASSANETANAGEKLDAVGRVLEKQELRMKILRNQTLGLATDNMQLGDSFTNGQASQLANLKMMGATSDQIKELARSFQDYNKFTGINTFDKSASGLARINKEVEELRRVNELAAKNLSLTKDEVVALSRDSLRLEQAFKAEKKTAQELAAAHDELTKKYATASAERSQLMNTAKAAEAAVRAEAEKTLSKQKDITRQEQELALMRKTMWSDWANGVGKANSELQSMAAFYKDQEQAANRVAKANQDVLASTQRLAAITKQMQSGTSAGDAAKTYDLRASGVEEQAIQALIKAEREHAQAKLATAKASGTANAGMSASEKAAAYLEKEERRLAFALEEVNKELGIGAGNRLLRYQDELKKAGVAADVAAKKYAAYAEGIRKEQEKTRSIAMADQEGKLRNLSRAVSVQMGDVGVSLASGQNPFTVMIQQGDQLRAAMEGVTVDAATMRRAMEGAAKQIATGFIATGQAVGMFFVGAVRAASTAVIDLVRGPFTELLAISRRAQSQEALDFIGPKAPANLMVMNSLMSQLPTLLTITTAAAGLLGYAFFNAAKEATEMNRALILQGASLGVTSEQVSLYAKSLEQTGTSHTSVLEVIKEMASASGFVKSDIEIVTKSAIDLDKYGGVAISDTVKRFAELKKDPVEALIKLGKETGLVTLEQIKNIETTLKLKGAYQAATDAMLIMDAANAEAIQRLKDEAGTLDKLGFGIKGLWGDVGNYIKGVGRPAEATIENLRKAQDALVEQQAKLAKLPKTDVMRYTEATEAVKRQSEEVERLLRLLGQAAKAPAAADQAALAKQQEASGKVLAEYQKQAAGYREKELTQQQFIAAAQAKYTKTLVDLPRDEKAATAELARRKEELDNLAVSAAEVWKGMQPKGTAKVDPFIAMLKRANDAYISITGKQKELNTAQIEWEQIQASPVFAQRSIAEKDRLKVQWEATIAVEKQIEQTTKLEKGQDLLNSLIGKGEGLGKAYYETLDKLRSLEGVTGIDPAELEQAYAALEATTPAAKAAAKALEATRKAYEELSKSSNDYLLGLQEQSSVLDLELDYLGSADTARERRIKLLKVEAQYQKELAAITAKYQAGELSNFEEREKLFASAETNRQFGIDVINKEQSFKSMKEVVDYFDKIRSGISDSVTTALFEGGNAGKKKLRDLLIAELKKPITLYINAIINEITGGKDGKSSGTDMAKQLFGMADQAGLLGSSSSVASMTSAFKAGGALTMSGAGGTGLALEGAGTMIQSGQYGAGVAQGAGALAPWAAGIGAGYFGGKAVSGGYGFGDNGGDTAVAIGTAIGGAILGPLGAALGGLAGGAFNRIWGRKTTEQGIKGTFGGEQGFAGQGYTFEKGGWLRDDKTTPFMLDSGTQNELAAAYKSTKISVTELSKTLGIGTEALAGFTKDVKINVMGLSEADANKAIQAEFSKLSDSMVDAVFNVKEFRRANETSTQTLQRMSSTLAGINDVFKLLDITLLDISLSGLAAGEEIIALFGGVDKATTALNNYYKKFFTTEEQVADSVSTLEQQFKRLGIAMPVTADAFKQIVSSQDKTTSSGRAVFAQLIQMSDSFYDIVDASKQLSAKLATEVLSVFNNQETSQGLTALRNSIVSSVYGTPTKAAVKNLSSNMQSIFNGQSTKDNLAKLQQGINAAVYNSKLVSSSEQLTALITNAMASNSVQASSVKLQDFIVAAMSGTPTLLAIAELDAAIASIPARNIQAVKDTLSTLSFADFKQAVTGVFEQIASSFGEMITSINQERLATREAARSIITGGKDQVSSYADIKAVVEAQNRPDLITPAAIALGEAQKVLPALQGNLTAAKWLLNYYKTVPVIPAGEKTTGGERFTSQTAKDAQITRATAAVAKAEAELSNAREIERSAVLAMVTATASSTPVIKASIKVLSQMRAETVKYYEAQKQLADGLISSAKSLRDVVDSYGKVDTFESLKQTFDSSFAAAQTVMQSVGTEFTSLTAEQADTLKSSAASIGSVYTGLLDFAKDNPVLQASLTSMATQLANYMDAAGVTIAVDAQTKSLELLAEIDSTLGALELSMSSAEQVISKAIYDTGADNLTGLRGVITALGGVPAFATGGMHSGGLRLVGEQGVELEATGPSRIFNASQTAAMLSGSGSGMSNTSALELKLDAMINRLDMIEAATRTSAVANNKLTKTIDRVIAPGGDSVQTTVLV